MCLHYTSKSLISELDFRYLNLNSSCKHKSAALIYMYKFNLYVLYM